MLTNTYGSLAFQESIRRYTGTERHESNLVMRLYGLVNQERMLLDEQKRCQSPRRSILQDGADLLLLPRLFRHVLTSIFEYAGYPSDEANRELLKRINRQLLVVQWNVWCECDAYNSFHSRNVCAAIYHRFPRELRDMVYEHITSEEVTVCAGPKLSILLSLRFITERWYPSSPCTSQDRLCGAHYWRIEVAGYEVQKELIESWYRNSTFHLDFPRGTLERHHDFILLLNLSNTRQNCRPAIVLDRLPRMLEHDRFGLGFKPEQLLRNIVVVLDLPARADDHFGSILTGLDNLALLRQRANIHLRLRLPQASLLRDEETTAHALQHWLYYVHPSLWRLKRAGYDLLVTFDCVTTTKAHTQVLDRWREEFELEAKQEISVTN